MRLNDACQTPKYNVSLCAARNLHAAFINQFRFSLWGGWRYYSFSGVRKFQFNSTDSVLFDESIVEQLIKDLNLLLVVTVSPSPNLLTFLNSVGPSLLELYRTASLSRSFLLKPLEQIAATYMKLTNRKAAVASLFALIQTGHTGLYPPLQASHKFNEFIKKDSVACLVISFISSFIFLLRTGRKRWNLCEEAFAAFISGVNVFRDSVQSRV